MSYTIKTNTKYFVTKEDTEGTYKAPVSGDDAVQCLMDGSELKFGVEQLEMNILGQGLAKRATRNGAHSVSGAIKSYMKAGETVGTSPEAGILIESCLGATRSNTEKTSTTLNTTSLIKLASTTGFNIGDTVLVKEAGKYHVSPIKAIVVDTSIELLIPMDVAPANGVKVAAFKTYLPANSGHPSFSVTKHIEDLLVETARGCKTKTMAIENFKTNQIANFNFTFDGLDFSCESGTPAFTPTFQTSETPTIIEACILKDGAVIEANELTLSIENTNTILSNTCAGKTSQRATARVVKGTIDPYKQTDTTDFDKFVSGGTFSLFVQAKNPTVVDGEYAEYICFYIPKAKISELVEADQDGVLKNTISFNATSDDGTPEIFLTFI